MLMKCSKVTLKFTKAYEGRFFLWVVLLIFNDAANCTTRDSDSSYSLSTNGNSKSR